MAVAAAAAADPIVSSLLTEAVLHGHAVVASVQGALLTVCCAVARIVLLIYDLACLQFQCLGHSWGFAFVYAVGDEGGGSSLGKHSLLANNDRCQEGSDLAALEEGANFEVDQLPETSPPLLALAQKQRRSR